MTESQILALAWRLGPWAGFILALVYIAANKVGPIWLADWREARKLARAKEEAERLARVDEEKEERRMVTALYERLVDQSSEMTRFIASATEAIHSLGRSVDANTQELYRHGKASERVLRCPLPGCLFIKDEPNDTSSGG